MALQEGGRRSGGRLLELAAGAALVGLGAVTLQPEVVVVGMAVSGDACFRQRSGRRILSDMQSARRE